MNELVLKTQEDLIALAEDTIKRNNIITSKNFNASNAMVALYNNVLTVKDRTGKMAIETCTPRSIQNAVYQCIVNELTPAKNQAYFIPYGSELTFTMSYFGIIKLMKDKYGFNVNAQVVREGDAFEPISRPDATILVKHKINPQSIWNNKPIVGAYCVLSTDDGRVINSGVMSFQDIKTSALKSKSDAKVFKEFPEEMSKKIVLRRTCKPYLNASDDSAFVKIKNPDGTTTVIANYDDTLRDDFEGTDYTIDANDTFEPTEDQIITPNEDRVTSADLKLDDIPVEEPKAEIPEGAIEIDYNEVKGGKNKDKYKVIPNSFNKSKYTCWVMPL